MSERSLRLGLLECDHVAERLTPIAGDYRDMFAALLAPVLPDVELVAYDACAGELPVRSDECDAWLATGSRFSAYDDLPWIHALGGFLRDVQASSAPFVGVCFGHQLLAQALGGKVEQAAGGWGAGAHALEVAGTAAWMDPPTRTMSLLFMHQDQVTALPPGGEVVARTDHCPVAMFTVGPTMLGIQAHPEFEAPFVAALLAARTDRIGAEKTATARASLAQPTDAGLAARWLARFLRAASEGPGRSGAPGRSFRPARGG